MSVTEDRTTALLERPGAERTGGGAAGRQRPEGDQAVPAAVPAPRPFTGVDERAMRWAMLGSFLLGLYAVLFVVVGVWLT